MSCNKMSLFVQQAVPRKPMSLKQMMGHLAHSSGAGVV